jgi:hypothetical protein
MTINTSSSQTDGAAAGLRKPVSRFLYEYILIYEPFLGSKWANILPWRD